MSSIKLTADSGGGTFEIKAPSSSGNTRVLTLPDTGNLTLGKTGILQVVQTVKTDTTSQGSAGSFADISGVSVTITPSSSSNKILIIPDLALGGSDMSGYHLIWRLLRGSTPIAVATTATAAQLTGTGGMHRAASGANAYFFGCSKIFVDSPATTSAVTYNLGAIGGEGAVYYKNRGESDSSYHFPNAADSTITLMEVSA